MNRSLFIVCIMMLSAASHLLAQQKNTSLKSTTIEVLQSYKPEVKQAARPELKPDLPPSDTSRPTFKYDVPQQTLYYTYTSLPLRPLALGKDTSKLRHESYLKLGAGSQNTIYGDAGITNLKGENYETAIHLHHLSQKGAIKNQKISLSGLEAEGTLHAQNHAWRLSLEGVRNRYHYYGYDHDMFDYLKDSVQQTYSGIQAVVDVRNEGSNTLNLNYHPRIGISYYGDNHNVGERTVLFDLPVSKNIDSNFQIGVGINGSFTRLNTPFKDVDNNVFQITPKVDIRAGNFEGAIGLYPTFGMNGNSFLLPDINLRFRIPQTRVLLSAGWTAALRKNTYRELSSVNPYIFNIYATRQTRTDEIFGMLSCGIGDHFTISGRVSWRQFADLPMFLNDTLDSKKFYILYDENVNAFSFQAALRYHVANTFSIGGAATFTSFGAKTYDRVWHQPGINIKGDVMLQPLPEFTVSAYVLFMDQIYALNPAHEEVKLDAIFDVGGTAEYQFIPNLSAFITLSNLFNARYERWYGYQAYGINIYGGLRLKF